MLFRSARAQSRGVSLIRVINGRTVISPQISLRFRRQYGGVIRAIVSKHVESISDLVRPVLPRPAVADSLPRKPKSKAPIIGGRSDSYPSSRSTSSTPAAVELEDDIATETQSDPGAETELQMHVRKSMRKVPHPVAIITSTDPNSPPNTNTAYRGMTVSSFNTVTLKPTPIVSFNVKTPSETYNAIKSSSRFLVHLLCSNPDSAQLASKFSKGYENVLREDGKNALFQFISPSNVNAMPSISTGEPPRLIIRPEIYRKMHDNGFIPEHFSFIFECQYMPQSTTVGDHDVVFGKVVNIINEDKDSLDDVHHAEDLCLTYADTRFWSIGDHLKK